MDRLKRFTQAMSSVSLAISVVIAQQAASWIEKQPVASRWLPTVVALVIFGVVSQTLQFLLDLVFENARGLRRLLLGRQFIEGSWFIIFKNDGNPTAVGVTRIESVEGSVRFSGEDFSVEGEKVVDSGQGHYRTELVVLDWPKIKYVYTDNQANGSSTQGYGEAQFVEGDRSCEKFSGHFHELLGSRTTYYEGWRINDDETLAALEGGPITRRRAIERFFNEMNPKKNSDPNDSAKT